MSHPDFFHRLPVLTLYDPLAHMLGASSDGTFIYRYLDAVRLCGHSCPTVAGAYITCMKGLYALYGDALPRRGEIAVELPGKRDEGTHGVVGSVIGLITGAAGEEGFKGMGRLYPRDHLLRFREAEDGGVVMTRTDTGMRIAVEYFPENAGVRPADPELVGKILRNQAGDEERDMFARQWQKNVETLFDARDRPGVFRVRRLG
jgi:hypothetical protein